MLGDPPDTARFAAFLVPPAGRTDLPVAVLPELAIASDGGIAGIAFPEAILVRGRVLLACPANGAPYTCGEEESVGAQIRVQRASWFAGGPPYTRLIEAAPGVAPRVRTRSRSSCRAMPTPSTASPSSRPTRSAATASRRARSRRRAEINVRADSDREVDWVLGDPDNLKVVRGCVQNVIGDGSDYADMRVVAFGRWTKLSPLERASSRSITGPDGCFELSVPRKMLDEFDITVQPAAGVTLPTYTLHGEFVRDPANGEQAVRQDRSAAAHADRAGACHLPPAARGAERVRG